MKLNIGSVALLIASANAFSPSIHSIQLITASTTNHPTKLNLFGGKKTGGDDSAAATNEGGGGLMGGGGGMMDQMKMFQKAQEIAKKKNNIDKDIANMDMIGSSVDGKIKVTVKYTAAKIPVTPQASYDIVNVDIDDVYFNEASAEDLSANIVEAVKAGQQVAAETVMKEYQSLQEDITGLAGAM